MKQGELILAATTTAFAGAKLLTSIYTRALNFLEKRKEEKHADVLAPLIAKRRHQKAFVAKLNASIDQEMNKNGSAMVHISLDQVVVENRPKDSISVKANVGGFLHRHPELVYLGMASAHTLLYFSGRRAFSGDETYLDSLRESVAAASIMVGAAAVGTLQEAYKNTLDYVTKNNESNALIESSLQKAAKASTMLANKKKF